MSSARICSQPRHNLCRYLLNLAGSSKRAGIARARGGWIVEPQYMVNGWLYLHGDWRITSSAHYLLYTFHRNRLHSHGTVSLVIQQRCIWLRSAKGFHSREGYYSISINQHPRQHSTLPSLPRVLHSVSDYPTHCCLHLYRFDRVLRPRIFRQTDNT